MDAGLSFNSPPNPAEINRLMKTMTDFLLEFVHGDHNAREALHALTIVSVYFNNKNLNTPPEFADSHAADTVILDPPSDVPGLLKDVILLARHSIDSHADDIPMVGTVSPTPIQRTFPSMKPLLLPAASKSHARTMSASSLAASRRRAGQPSAVPLSYARQKQRNSSAPPGSRSPTVLPRTFVSATPPNPSPTPHDNHEETTSTYSESSLDIPAEVEGNFNVPLVTLEPPSRSQTLEGEELEFDPTALSTLSISSGLQDEDMSLETTEPDYSSICDNEPNASFLEHKSETHPSDQYRGRIPQWSTSSNSSRSISASPSPSSRRAYSASRSAPPAHTRTQSDPSTTSSRGRFVRPCHSNGNLRSSSRGPTPNTVHLPEDILSPRGRKALDNANPNYKGPRNRLLLSAELQSKIGVSKKSTPHNKDIKLPTRARAASFRDVSSERRTSSASKPLPHRKDQSSLAGARVLRNNDPAVTFPQIFIPREPMAARAKGKAKNAPTASITEPVHRPSTLSLPLPPSPHNDTNNADSAKNDDAGKPESKDQLRSPMTWRFSMESSLTVCIDSGDEGPSSPGSSDSDHYSSGDANAHPYQFVARSTARHRKRRGTGGEAPVSPASPAEGRERTISMSTEHDYVLEHVVEMRRKDELEHQ